LSQDCRNRLYLIGKGLPLLLRIHGLVARREVIDVVIRIAEEVDTDPIDEFVISKPVAEPRDVHSYRATL